MYATHRGLNLEQRDIYVPQALRAQLYMYVTQRNRYVRVPDLYIRHGDL